MNKDQTKLTVSLVDTEIFQELLQVANEMLTDNDIPWLVRDRYITRIEELNFYKG